MNETRDPPEGSTAGYHLTTDEVAGFVEQVLGAEHKTRVTEHLADCAHCQAAVVRASQTLRLDRRSSKLAVGVPLAAAAIIALVVLNPFAGDPDGPLLRSEFAPDVAAARIAVHQPADSTRMGDLGFAWASVESGIAYRISLTTADGSDVWTGGTADTSIVLPSETDLTPGAVYYWSVDALLADGRSATTGIRRLYIEP